MKNHWKQMIGVIFAIIAVIGAGAAVLMCSSRPKERDMPAAFFPPVTPTPGFVRADPSRVLEFPADYGAHPEFQTEWWYYTGNLQGADGRRFGYQLTFFRRALIPPGEIPARSSRWAVNQVYMAHFAITDVDGRSFRYAERFSRGAAGLAGAQIAPYRVWLEDWEAKEVEVGTRHLRATDGDVAIDLSLIDQKGPILHGERGYSRKGPEPGNASHYYSLTRLTTTGIVSLAGKVYPVVGASWMDHEFSTSALGANQVGWDWFALQLDDGRELMLFQIRQANGRVDPVSSGTLIESNGKIIALTQNDFHIDSTAVWHSLVSGADYPARWTIRLPSMDMTLEVEPYLANQELRVSFTYWEGAVSIRGKSAGRPVRGSGYVELTGYAASMQGQF